MAFLKKYPLFFSIMVVLLLVFLGGWYLVFVESGKAKKAAATVDASVRSLNSALALSPAPLQENLEKSAQNLEELRAALRVQLASTEGTNPAILSGQAPRDESTMLFQLQAYRNQLTQQAQRIIPVTRDLENNPQPGIGLPADFAWGFSRFIDQGRPPAERYIPQIFKQKEILNYIVEQLLETRPASIVAVQRETVVPRESDTEGTRRQQTGGGKDEFSIGSETARVRGAVNTMAFRIVFTGYTVNLRNFLTNIEEFELPLVVRSVEVRPLQSGGAATTTTRPARTTTRPANPFEALMGGGSAADTPAATAAEAAGQEPVVSENESEFTVVIEYLDIQVDPSGNVAATQR